MILSCYLSLERHQRLAPTLTGYVVRILGPDLACIITDTGSYLLLGADIFYRLVGRQHTSKSDHVCGEESANVFHLFDFNFWVAS